MVGEGGGQQGEKASLSVPRPPPSLSPTAIAAPAAAAPAAKKKRPGRGWRPDKLGWMPAQEKNILSVAL